MEKLIDVKNEAGDCLESRVSMIEFKVRDRP